MTSSKPVVGVLGPLAIHTAVGPQAVCGQQGLVLAVLAAAHPHPVAGEALLDELWSDRPPSSARTALRVVLTRLRERLRPTGVRIVHDGGAYRLDTAEDQVDHLRFLAMIERATAISGREPLAAGDLLQSALDLWRGEPFAPFTDAERIRAVAVQLAEQRRHAEESLVEALLAGGRPAVAATVATSLVEAEPYRERRWEQLMLALYRSGRQAQALHTARRATGLLLEELGIEPWPGLRVLERDILCQAPHLDAPDARVDLIEDCGAAERVRLDLDRRRSAGPPVMAGELIGRENEVDAVTALLAERRLISLVGPPGVGKTRLAAHLAAGRAHGGVIWFDLIPITDRDVVAELAGLVGVRVAGPTSVHDLTEAFDREPTLLVLDNCEHVAGPVADLAERLLSACPDLTVLATGRMPLASPSEEQYPVTPLTAPAARRLLAIRAGTPRPPDDGGLARLADQLDRLPLSLELVAPALAATPAGELADHLAHSLELAAGRGRADPRHASLEAALAWSVDLLPPADREVFELLGVLPGSVEASDVADLAGCAVHDVQPALARLSGAGLLTRDPGVRTTWFQLNTVRVHARARLRSTGRLDELSRATAIRHVDLVTILARQLNGPDEDAAVARLDRAGDHLRATHRWLVEQQAVVESALFTRSLWEDTFFRQRYDRYHWLEDTLALPGAAELADHDLLLGEAALAAWARGRLAGVLQLADRAEMAAAAAGRPAPLSSVKARFNLAIEEERHSEAAALLGRLLVETAERDDLRHHCDNRVVAALGLTQLGLDEQAAASAEQATMLARATANPTCIAWAGVGLAASRLRADPGGAVRAYADAARLARTVRNRWVEGMAMSGLVTALRRAGRADRARELVVPVIELWTRNRNAGQLAKAVQEGALLLADGGHRGAAVALLDDLDLSMARYPMTPEDAGQLAELRRAPGGADASSVGPEWDRVITTALGVLNSRPATDRAPAPPLPVG